MIIRPALHLMGILIFLIGPISSSLAQQASWLTGDTSLPSVIPENLCSCSKYAMPPNGVETRAQFHEKYNQLKISTELEAALAWRVFRAANRCDAPLVIGRLDDTEQLVGRSGICILRDYRDWTPSINDTFVIAGIDRQATFVAVSPPPQEIEIEPDGDMRHHRRNIYNKELNLVRSSKKYGAVKGIEFANPDNPVRFVPINNSSDETIENPVHPLPSGNYKFDGDNEIGINFTCTGYGHNQCLGTYSGAGDKKPAKVVGTYSPNGLLTGHWVEAESAEDCQSTKHGSTSWGRLVFMFSSNVTSWIGTWNYCDKEPDISWNGQRS